MIDLAPQKSSDPMAAGRDSGVFTPGQVMTIHSKEELESLLQAHPDQLAVVMCKVSRAALQLGSLHEESMQIVGCTLVP
jgi:hypothetical protein